ncbi:MAG: hypothetical protein JWQ09_2368 [Segetibacter sp.]|nr:hypothetical protein [Segetibacter sp.]
MLFLFKEGFFDEGWELKKQSLPHRHIENIEKLICKNFTFSLANIWFQFLP